MFKVKFTYRKGLSPKVRKVLKKHLAPVTKIIEDTIKDATSKMAFEILKTGEMAIDLKLTGEVKVKKLNLNSR